MAEQAQIIKKVMDFSLRPGPRFREQGKNSGEAFYPELKEWFADAEIEPEWLKLLNDKTFPAWELRRREGRKPRETQPVE